MKRNKRMPLNITYRLKGKIFRKRIQEIKNEKRFRRKIVIFGSCRKNKLTGNRRNCDYETTRRYLGVISIFFYNLNVEKIVETIVVQFVNQTTD